LTEENLTVSFEGLPGKVLGEGIGKHVVRRAVVDLDDAIRNSLAQGHHPEVDMS
jgi:hypothetical protein